jgi:hypothetical protein
VPLIDGIFPQILSYLSLLMTGIYLIFLYYSGDSLTKFLASPKEKILAFVFKQLAIISYDFVIVISLFSVFSKAIGVPVSELKNLNESENRLMFTVFILFFVGCYILSLYVLKFLNKYVLYNNHIITKTSNFYICLEEDFNTEFKKNDHVYFSVPSKKELLCYKIIKNGTQTDYLKIYLPIEFIKKHTIFSKKNPSPKVVRDENRNKFISAINKSRYGTIPVWLLIITVIMLSCLSVYNIVSAPNGFEIISLILYAPLLFWLWISLWWATGKEVIILTFKTTFKQKNDLR